MQPTRSASIYQTYPHYLNLPKMQITAQLQSSTSAPFTKAEGSYLEQTEFLE